MCCNHDEDSLRYQGREGSESNRGAKAEEETQKEGSHYRNWGFDGSGNVDILQNLV